MITKKTFGTTILLSTIMMIVISGTTQNVYAQMFSDAVPTDADVLLVELIDGSESITFANFQTIKTDLSAGLQATYDQFVGDPNLDLFGESYVVIIQFSTDGLETVECTEEVDDQGDLDNLKTCIGNIVYQAGATCVSCAFNEAVNELANVPAEFLGNDDRQIIDLISDGGPFPESDQTALDAEDAAIAAGYDRVVALGVFGINAVLDTAFLAQIVDPNPPGEVNPVVLPEEDGFVLVISSFDDFADAIERKLIGTVPPVVVVGGEFLPVDTTALLLLSVQTNATWLIPVVLSIAGIGIFVVSRRSENS